MKKETRFDLDDVMVRVDKISGRARDTLERLNSELRPQFVSWNKWENWKVYFKLMHKITVPNFHDRCVGVHFSLVSVFRI